MKNALPKRSNKKASKEIEGKQGNRGTESVVPHRGKSRVRSAGVRLAMAVSVLARLPESRDGGATLRDYAVPCGIFALVCVSVDFVSSRFLVDKFS